MAAVYSHHHHIYIVYWYTKHPGPIVYSHHHHIYIVYWYAKHPGPIVYSHHHHIYMVYWYAKHPGPIVCTHHRVHARLFELARFMRLSFIGVVQVEIELTHELERHTVSK